MIAIIILLVFAFWRSIAFTARGLANSRDAMAAVGITGMVVSAILLGGAVDRAFW